MTTAKGALSIATGTGLGFAGGQLTLADAYATGSAYDERFMLAGGEGSITLEMLEPAVISSLNGVFSNGDNIDLVAGENLAISANDIDNTIRLDAHCEGGDITDIVAGAGSGPGLTTRDVGDWGGEERHTLSISEMPSHNHGVTDPGHSHSVYDPGHSHGISDPGHSHGVSDPGHSHSYTDPTIGEYAGLNHDENGSAVEYPYGNWGTTASSTTGISINGAGTGISVNSAGTSISINSSGTGISTQNRGSGSSHNNMPPFYALAYIMRME